MPKGIESQAFTDDPGTSGLVSPIVAKVILENRPLLASDFTQPVPGIVLCADLSGFSMAGAALTRSDARRAEELQGIVNAVFTRVTEAIQSGGGQILQFSGDAVTAVWPAMARRHTRPCAPSRRDWRCNRPAAICRSRG